MKSHLDFLGKRMYLANEVVVTAFSFPKIYFKIQNRYEIFYNIDTFKFSDCTCQWGSYYGINGPEKCKHRYACMHWLINELEEYLEKNGFYKRICSVEQESNDERISKAEDITKTQKQSSME